MSNNYTKVLTDNAIIINRLQTLLENANIISRVSDQVESARLGGFGTPTNSVELFIKTTDLEKATSIINKYKEKINS